MNTTTYYKITGPLATSIHGGELQWSRPRGKKPGKWESVKGPLQICKNGLHVVTVNHVLDWNGKEIWEVEIDPTEMQTDGAKVCVRQARLLRLVMAEDAIRHFAVACAARVLPIFETLFPKDLRVRECLIACNGAAEAAWAAELKWQRRQIRKYLAGKVDITKPVRLPPRPKGVKP